MRNALKILSLTFLAGCGCEQVDVGYRGIETKFGEIQGEPKPEGLYFYNPLTSSIKEFNVQEQKFEGKATCFTRDTQRVDIDVAMTFYPDPKAIGKIYKEYGKDWEQKLVSQAVMNSVKDIVGAYIADDLVGKRDEARTKAETELKNVLANRSVIVTRLDFVNLDFDDAYEKAVEAKVVAVQKAAQAKNKTVEVEEQARQKVIAAQAEAESMRIRSKALTENKSLVEYEAVQKWDGKLPQYMLGNSTPFINIGK